MKLRMLLGSLGCVIALLQPAAASSPVTIESYDTFASTLQHARSITVTSYLLPKRLQAELVEACRRGAVVHTLLANPSYDSYVSRDNADAVSTLSFDRCTARLSTQPLHMKLVYADRVAWLSDTNFSDAGFLARVDDDTARSILARTLLGDAGRSSTFATRKDWALDLERAVLSSQSGPLCVATESFGRGMIAGTLADRHAPTRLVVSSREYNSSPYERALISRLPSTVDVRIGESNEKIAVGATATWFGSANATSGLPTQVDWGMISTDPTVIHTMQDRCLHDWMAATPLH